MRENNSDNGKLLGKEPNIELRIAPVNWIFMMTCVLLVLVAAGCADEYPAISGSMTICGNQGCAALLSDSVSVSLINYPANFPDRSEYERTDFSWAFAEYVVQRGTRVVDGHLDQLGLDYRRQRLIKDRLVEIILPHVERLHSTIRNHPGCIEIAGAFNIRNDTLCDSCSALYERLGISLSTPRKLANLMKAGFRTEIDAKDAIARKLGHPSYDEIDDEDPRFTFHKTACDKGYKYIVAYAGTLGQAVRKARQSIACWDDMLSDDRRMDEEYEAAFKIVNDPELMQLIERLSE